MNVKEKIEELREASEDGTITAAFYRSLSRAARYTASGVACMCGATYGRMISTFYSESMGAEFIRTILLCICGAIRIVPRQNIR